MFIAASGRVLRAALLSAIMGAAWLVAGPSFGQDPAKPPAAVGAPPAGAATAEDSAPEIEPKQVKLTPQIVEGFLAAWPEFEALREKLTSTGPQAKAEENPKNAPESDEAEIGEAEDPVGALAAFLDKPGAKGQIEAILAKHKFATYNDWADAAQSVLLAFGASDPDGGETDLAAEKRKVQSEIENDAALSDEEKQAALKDLDEQFAALESFQPLPGNVEVVKPYLEKIKALFGAEEN